MGRLYNITIALVIFSLTVGVITDVFTVLNGTQTHRAMFDEPIATDSVLFPLTHTVLSAAIILCEVLVYLTINAIYKIFDK